MICVLIGTYHSTNFEEICHGAVYIFIIYRQRIKITFFFSKNGL